MSFPKPGSGTVCTPDTLRCLARILEREGTWPGLQKNLTSTLFLQHGFRHSTSTSSEREEGTIIPPLTQSKGRPRGLQPARPGSWTRPQDPQDVPFLRYPTPSTPSGTGAAS